jgi:hypothetical protein
MTDAEKRIDQILESGLEIPKIFKSMLRREIGLGKEERILDVLLVRREYRNERDPRSPVHEPAKLLIATEYGLSLVEEGFYEIADSILGYRMKHVGYSKVTTVELDVSMLHGELVVSSYGEMVAQLKVSFNTARYFREFQEFIDLLRKKIIS